jgi:predicted TIM-barrel enzyme
MKEEKVFNIYKPVIGVIHVDAFPGTPNYNGDVKEIIVHAKKEALIYKENNIDIIAIENMHDVPYLKRAVGPEITSMMSVIGYEIKNLTNLPCGIQILAGANKELWLQLIQPDWILFVLKDLYLRMLLMKD